MILGLLGLLSQFSEHCLLLKGNFSVSLDVFFFFVIQQEIFKQILFKKLTFLFFIYSLYRMKEHSETIVWIGTDIRFI